MHVDDQSITLLLGRAKCGELSHVREVLAKAREARGLAAEEVSALLEMSDPELLEELFCAARAVKERIYGKLLVLFAPLYISNLCPQECACCPFRARNSKVDRRALTKDEMSAEARALIAQGHERLLLVAGESYPNEGLDYVLSAIDAAYAFHEGKGEIRRIDVNIEPLSIGEFRLLKDHHIGTYQLFQETYHRPTYDRLHVAGRKRAFNWRVTSIDRAIEAGIDDFDIGVLFGLADWRYEVLAILQHVQRLERRFGKCPRTISIFRLESDSASLSPRVVSDGELLKLVAILRLAVPHAGIILSSCETAHVRREAIALGVSQIMAASRTSPGGYSLGETLASLEGVARDIAEVGCIPSFCAFC